MPAITISINGSSVAAEVSSRTLLVHFLREHLGLTGTHIGCDTSQCGACVVHLDGRSIKSCAMLAVQANGKAVTTIEGLEKETLHPVQKAFQTEHGLQCGYCTPGMIMAVADLLRRIPDPDEAQIREQLEGNICRCTGYHNIVRAVQSAARTGTLAGGEAS